MKNLDGGSGSEKLQWYFRKHSMENKITEYGIFLSHKYKVEQTEVISRLFFTF